MPNRCPESVSSLQSNPFFDICALFSGPRLKASRWLALGMGLLLLWAMGPAAAQVYHWKSQTYVGGMEVRGGTAPEGSPALGITDTYGCLASQTGGELNVPGDLSLQLGTGFREQSAIRAAEAFANDSFTPITRQQVPIPGMIQPGQAVVAMLVGDELAACAPPTEAIARGTPPPPPNDDPGRDPDDTSPPIPLQPSSLEGLWIDNVINPSYPNSNQEGNGVQILKLLLILRSTSYYKILEEGFFR